MDALKTQAAWHHTEFTEDFGVVVCVWEDFTDAAPTMSVTNDIEMVTACCKQLVPAMEYMVYVDTEGDWCEIKLTEAGDFEAFYPILGTTAQEAIDCVRQRIGAQS
jgi:hypothetical protein